MGKKKVGRFIVDLGDQLGKGASAVVYRGLDSQTKQEVAVKVLNKDAFLEDEYVKKAFETEIRIMMRLKSQNIIKFLDVNQTKANFYVILQMANDGDFRQILLSNKKPLTQAQTIGYLVQLLNAFGQMFKIGVIHRDIKPDNIFVKNGVLKLGDFGFAKNNIEVNKMMSTVVGSPAYMAPQILHEQRYNYKCDIWSLGVMVYQMLFGVLPFQFKSKNLAAIYETIVKSKITFPDQIPISNNMKQFILGCLRVKEQQRFDWAGVFLHPLFKGIFKKNFDDMKKGEEYMGYIMGSLRMAIITSNINIKNEIKKLGKTVLNAHQFKDFLGYIHCQIQKQEVQILYDYLKKNQAIDLADFESILEKHGCRAKQQPIKQQHSSPEDNSFTLVKNLIRKINQQHKIDFEQFLPENAIETEKLSFNQFQTALHKIAPQIPKSQVQSFFTQVFGGQKSKGISTKQFFSVMLKICQQVPTKKKG